MNSELTRESIEARLKRAEKELARANEHAAIPNSDFFHGGPFLATKAREDIEIFTLALRALDMEPKPIAEALKDGTKIWAFWGGEWVKTYWAKRDKFEGWQMPQGMVIKAYAPETWKPTQFIPLSALTALEK